jgi:hypothetical protein
MYALLQFIQILSWQLLQWMQPLLVPLCFVLAWTVLGLCGWSLWTALRDGVNRARQMHRIPCAGCQYFSGEYTLKCSVHPEAALSEAAINCPDFKSDALVPPVMN